MGADLYINSLYDPQRARWEQKFEAAVKQRDSLPTDMGPTDQDVEGHVRLPGTGGDFMPRLPGTGGELRRPSGGGEATDDDVEGHRPV